MLFIEGYIFVAPSAPPDSVSISAVTSSSITVQWEMVPCIHRNGHITDYTVRFGIQGQITQTMAAPGDSSGGTYVISNLQSSTTYSIQVAAITGVNRIGPYSSTITEATSGEYIDIWYHRQCSLVAIE